MHRLMKQIQNRLFAAKTGAVPEQSRRSHWRAGMLVLALMAVLILGTGGNSLSPFRSYAAATELDSSVWAADFGRVARYAGKIVPSFLPQYYVDHLDAVLPEIRQNVAEIRQNGEAFIFITDLHWEGNRRYSPRLIRAILNSVRINTLICGGDLINEGDKDKMKETMSECVSALQFPDIPLPIARGNHDDNFNSRK